MVAQDIIGQFKPLIPAGICFRRAFILGLTALLFPAPAFPKSAAASVEDHFNEIKADQVLLREFLYGFPKGGELHTHLDGAVYAESYVRWAASDGKCIELASYTVTHPPCDTSAGNPPMADIQFDPDVVNPIIDAFSVRNYERGPVSGHDQFFATFARYSAADKGRRGSMLAEITRRAARQNTFYLEIMESFGMRRARQLAVESGLFDGGTAIDELASTPEFDALVNETMAAADRAERQWREELGCAENAQATGCAVVVRYLAQVIRAFPLDQILAQTLLAFKLIERDRRFVGLNFVAPEDAPGTLRDYSRQMEIIGDVAALFPGSSGGISLHAGELAMPLVPPREMRSHIYEAVHVAGARRIGHGVDVIYEEGARALVQHMASDKILVEINLTSNAIILGVEGEAHPFELYRSSGVPLALSTDDEGVARIDLTHEYVRATKTYDLSYAYLKELSRNALAYSFLQGESLFADIPSGKKTNDCSRDKVGRTLSSACRTFIGGSEKARLQWQLEQRFDQFEARYR